MTKAKSRSGSAKGKGKKTKGTKTKSKRAASTSPVDPADTWIHKDAGPGARAEFRRIVSNLQRLLAQKDADQFMLWETALDAERNPLMQLCLMGQSFDKFLHSLIGIPPTPYRNFVVALQYIAIAQLKFIGPTGTAAIGTVLRGLSNDAARTNMASQVFPLIFERFSKHIEMHGAPPANGSTIVYDIARQHGLWTKKGTSFKTQSAQAITTVRNMVLKNREGLTRIQNGSQCSLEVHQVMMAVDRIGTRFLTCLDESITDDDSNVAANAPTAAAS